MLAVSESVSGIVTRLGCATPTSGGAGVRLLGEAAGGGSAPAGLPAGTGAVPRPRTRPRPKAATTDGIQIQDPRVTSARLSLQEPAIPPQGPRRRACGSPYPA